MNDADAAQIAEIMNRLIERIEALEKRMDAFEAAFEGQARRQNERFVTAYNSGIMR